MNVQVTQAELKEISELERDIAPKARRVEELKEGVKALLLAKKPVEMGRFDARLKILPGRHVPWRQGFIDRLGLAAAEAYKKLFPVQVRFDVMVEEHAVMPLWKGGEPGQEEATS
jgi:hypothetical protein